MVNFENIKLLVQEFVTNVRPILEYASSTWSPSTITNTKTVEMAKTIKKKHFTDLLKCLHAVDYRNRLLALGLDSLELRRRRADLTLTYKILFGLIHVDSNKLTCKRLSR